MTVRIDALIDDAVDTCLERGEVGVQLSVRLGGDVLVERSAGTTAPDGGERVSASTLFPIFSVSKAVTATALHILVARGRVSYEDPIATLWPEFAACGKGDVTVRDVLTHRAGVPQMPADVTPELLGDWTWVTSRLAAMEPMFPRGAAGAYHSLSWGWIVGEVIQRADPAGRPFASFVREELLDPLGVEDLHFGLPAAEHARVATLTTSMAAAPAGARRLAVVPSAIALAPSVYNRSDMRAAVSPGAGGIATASSVSRVMSLLAGRGSVDGVELLPADLLMSLTRPRERSDEPDAITGSVRYIGIGGYWLAGPAPPALRVFGDAPHVLGHPGAGGSYAWADMDTGLAVAILHNRMFDFEDATPQGNPFVELSDAIRTAAEEVRAHLRSAP